MGKRKKTLPVEPFPDTFFIYSYGEDYDKSPLYIPAEDSCEIPDGIPVGIYTLQEVRTKRVTHEVE